MQNSEYVVRRILRCRVFVALVNEIYRAGSGNRMCSKTLFLLLNNLDIDLNKDTIFDKIIYHDKSMQNFIMLYN